MKKLVLLLFLGSIIWACTNDDSTPEETQEVDFDRTEMLINWADNIIMPAYQDLSNKIGVMELAANAFVDEQNNSTLTSFREAWQDAYLTWQRVSMFEIGPAELVSLRSNLNIYPADDDTIDANILAGSYNLDLSSNRPAKGFPALDYLLYGVGDTDQDVLVYYQDSQGTNARQYLLAITADMQLLVEGVQNEWSNNYRDIFVSNSGASATASVDRFVNDYIFYFEKHLRAGKIGIPAGVFSGNVLPENLEGRYRGHLAKIFFLEGLNAQQDFFNGKHYNNGARGESLSTYLDELNTLKDGEDLSALINTQFNDARTSVSALTSFSEELLNSPPSALLSAYDQVQRLVPLLKVDMVSAMSISIDFVDADGD